MGIKPMIKLAKDNLYISIVIVMAILKIAGVIDIGWIWSYYLYGGGGQ